MTHRAGLAYGFTSVGPIAHAHEEALGPPLGTPLTPDQWLKALGGLPLSYPPGERFHYSHATEVLGFLVARIEGKPLGQVLKDRIFGPLGMADTDFWCPPEKRDRMAKLYRMNPDTEKLEDVSFPHVDAPAGVRGGRRRPDLHRRRLSEVRPHAAGQGRGRRRAAAEGRDRRDDGARTG